MDNQLKITVLGSRGSLPVSGPAYTRYGGATISVLVEADGQRLLLDGGTGLLNLPPQTWKEQTVSLFFTHPHLDHMLGVPLCAPAMTRGCTLHVYGVPRQGRTVREQLCTMLAPPLWPVGPDLLPADFVFHDLPSRLTLGAVTVDSREGFHPGGVTLYRITAHNKCVVLFTDCTVTEQNRDTLLDFCRDCDLLLCDGQYSDDEWPTRAAFGHNTWNEMARFGRDCGAKQTRILHHDPTHTDAILDAARQEVQTICPTCTLTYDGEELTL